MQQLIPTYILLEYAKTLILHTTFLQLVRIATTRYAQQNIAMILLHIEQVNISRRRHQRASVIVDIISHAIVATIWVAKGLKQSGFTILALSKQTNHLFCLLFFGDYRTIFCDDLLHAFFQQCHHFRSYFLSHFTRFANGAIKTATDWVFNTQVTIRPQFSHCTSHHHTQCTDITTLSTFAGCVNKLNIFWLVNQEVKVLNLVIYSCCNHWIRHL